MKKYSFLFKPVFFIFSLIFASWLVLKIEKLKPSDFGKLKNLLEETSISSPSKFNESDLKKLFLEYKFGIINSRELDQKLDAFFNTTEAKPLTNKTNTAN